jgi:AraC-like DNA-binding protein
MKNFLVIILLLTTQFMQSRSFVVNDSLAKFSFENIRVRLVESLEDEKWFKLYSDYFIRRAKAENDINMLIQGYGFKVEHYPFNKALKYADSMLAVVKNKAPKDIFIYYYKMGNLYSGNRKNKKGLEYYLLAYKNCPKSDEVFYNGIKTQIGVIRSTLGQDQEAIVILKENENYYKEKFPQQYLFQQYIMAEIYNSLFELETAKVMIDKGLILSKELKSEWLYDRLIATKGVNLYSRKEYQKALDLLTPILKNASFVKEDFSDYAFVSYYIGKSYEGLENKNSALKYFKKVDSVFVKYNDIYSWNIDTYKFLIDFYKEKSDLKNQLVYTDRLIKADSLLMSSNEFALKKLNKEYDIPNLILEKETIINQLKTRDNFSKFLIAFLVITIAGLGFVIYRNKKRNREKIQLLQTDIEKYLAIQHKNFEDKNKFSISETISHDNNQEIQGKMSDLAKDNILNSLLLFEKNKGFIKNNCSLENVSKEMNTNKTYLSKIINEHKGYSFSAYINNLRIEYVIELLKEDEKIRKYSIESIAEEVGYNNVKAFSKAFYERIGMKPSVFLRNIKK